MLAEQTKLDAERLLSAAAILAGTVAYPRIDDYEIICSIDDSDRVRTHYPCRRDIYARQAFEDEQVEMIERGSEDAYPHFTRAWRRDWKVFAELETLEAAVRGDG